MCVFSLPKNGMTKHDLNGGATIALLKVEVSSKIQELWINVHRQWRFVFVWPCQLVLYSRFIMWSTIHWIRTIGLCMFPAKWKGWGSSWFVTKMLELCALSSSTGLYCAHSCNANLSCRQIHLSHCLMKARLKNKLIFFLTLTRLHTLWLLNEILYLIACSKEHEKLPL